MNILIWNAQNTTNALVKENPNILDKKSSIFGKNPQYASLSPTPYANNLYINLV